MEDKKHISNYIKIDWEYEVHGEKWVRVLIDEGYPRPATHLMSYASYLMVLKLNRWLEVGEYVYHINRDWKDDRIENLKVIDTRPQPIEVKYPFDHERYHATINWNKYHKKYFIYLYLKKKYKNDKSLKRQIQKSLKKYIVETEKLKRLLNDDEKVIFKDGDRTNYDVDNLKVIEGINKKLPRGKVPFQDYRIGSEFKEQVSNRTVIILHHIKDRSKQTSIVRSKYRYCIKIGRLLERNEYIVYKDGNHLNDNLDNLTHKTYPQAEYPFEDFFISDISTNRNDKRKYISLYHKTNYRKSKNILYSRYRMQVIEKRILNSNEEVDHIDANPWNDADDNLQILTKEEHKLKTKQDRNEKIPKVEICCSGCETYFTKYLEYIRHKLKHKKNKANNIFCSYPCFSRNKGKVGTKSLIKYICTCTGKVFWIPENGRILPSKFNPDALPFYDSYAVLDWIKQKTKLKS